MGLGFGVRQIWQVGCCELGLVNVHHEEQVQNIEVDADEEEDMGLIIG